MLWYQQALRLLMIALVAWLLSTCGVPPTPTLAGDIRVQPNSITVGGTANLTIEVKGNDLQFQWTAAKGIIAAPSAPSVVYTAPDTPGSDVVTVTVIGSGGQVVKSINIEVVAPATPQPTSTAQTTAIPTNTSAARPTLAPPSANISTPIPGSATLATPTASAIKMNVADGDEVAQTMTLIGEYPSGFKGDLWVFVAPPSELLYPQSPNACEGQGTPKANGKWEIRTGFGGPDNEGIPFQIILAAADPGGSKIIADTLKSWCRSKQYPGMEQLPEGVTAIGSPINVTRTAERWGPTPEITNAQLSGNVTLTNVAEGDKIPQQLNLTGLYNPDTTGDIWVLLYASNGRWYPQSTNACKGVHTRKASGQWQVLASFGGAANVGEPFDIAVVLADAKANELLDAKQKEWCAAKDFKGWLTVELPQGLAEKVRLRVWRK